MKKNQTKKHKECVYGSENKLKGTHRCLHEDRIVRDGNINFIDLACHPINEKFHKPGAFECEVNSSRAQRQENWKDLQKWKENFPQAEVFQISNPEDFEPKKLHKNQLLRKGNFTGVMIGKKKGGKFF